MFAPKLKFGLIQYGVRPKSKPMNKSPDKMGLNLFEQAHRKISRIFMKFFKFLEIKRSFIKNDKEVRQLFVYVEFP